MRLEIKSAEFETKSGVSRAGQNYSIREQVGYAQLGLQVRAVRISLGPQQPVYPAGWYTVEDTSWTTDRYDQLVLGRLVLKPIAAAAAQPAPRAQAG